MVGWLSSTIVALGLMAVGATALVAPRASSTQYGVAVDDPRALGFIRAMGIRDIVIGVLLGLLIEMRARDALAWAMFTAAMIAVVDLAVVATDRRPGAVPGGNPGRSLVPCVLHATGALLLVATGIVLRAGG